MKKSRILGKILGLSIFAVIIGFPVVFALYWLYVSLQPGIFPYL